MHESYKALWSHNFVASEDEQEPEIATNDEWRAIMVRARKGHGLTQEQLAEDVGTSQVMISKIESGVTGSSKLVLPICRRLSIPEPQNFADEAQKEWSQLGHLLRHKGGDQYEAALQLLRSMAKRIEEADTVTNDNTVNTDRRK
jgi:transcriptional regulator with XRE-family HTH domain